MYTRVYPRVHNCVHTCTQLCTHVYTTVYTRVHCLALSISPVMLVFSSSRDEYLDPLGIQLKIRLRLPRG